MTIREFADKYGVPYNTVYEATYKVPCYSTMRKDREYPEEDLFREVERIITARMEKHRQMLSKANQAFISLHSTRKKEGFPP